ncbi:MAG: hypothetical protein AAF721_33370, partial [Myxococcota bacterium]
RKAIAAADVVFGRRVLFVRDGLGARGVTWRAALWRTFVRPPVPPRVPEPGAVSVEPEAEVDPDFYLRIGYPIIAGRAVRADQLERAASHLSTLGPGPWPLPPELGAWLGVRRHRVETIVSALGYRKGDKGWAPAPKKKRSRGRRPKRS